MDKINSSIDSSGLFNCVNSSGLKLFRSSLVSSGAFFFTAFIFKGGTFSGVIGVSGSDCTMENTALESCESMRSFGVSDSMSISTSESDSCLIFV